MLTDFRWRVSSNSNEDVELDEQADDVEEVLDLVRGVASGEVADGLISSRLTALDTPSKMFLIVLSNDSPELPFSRFFCSFNSNRSF